MGTIPQRSCGSPIPGGIQSKLGWDPGQPDGWQLHPWQGDGIR